LKNLRFFTVYFFVFFASFYSHSSPLLSETFMGQFQGHISEIKRYYRRPNPLFSPLAAKRYDEDFQQGILLNLEKSYSLLSEIEKIIESRELSFSEKEIKIAELLSEYQRASLDYIIRFNNSIRPSIRVENTLLNLMLKEFERVDALLVKLHGLLVSRVLEERIKDKLN